MNAFITTKELIRDFIALLFPKICIHCGTTLVHQEEHLCTKCRLDLPKTNFHLVTDNPLKQKFVYEPKVQSVSSYLYFNKRGISQAIIHNLKYKGYEELGILMGKWYGEDLKKANWEIDYIIPVPLHKSKLAKRGFNQSERFAAGLSESMEVPVREDLVIRQIRTNTQTRKTRVERLQNVKSIYKVLYQDELQDKNVLIVDDVLTTGATIGELAVLLGETGVDKIYVTTIAAGK